MTNQPPTREQYAASDAWGISASVDLHSCNPATIRDAGKIKQFVVELCNLIDMKRFGECTVVNFGEDERVAGYSMVQLIETSLISGHFSNQSNNVYLDIFSCKYYDSNEAAKFAVQFFEAESVTVNCQLRA